MSKNIKQLYIGCIALALFSASSASYHTIKSPNIYDDVGFVAKTIFSYGISPLCFTLGTIYPILHGLYYFKTDSKEKNALSWADIKSIKQIGFNDGTTEARELNSQDMAPLIKEVALLMGLDGKRLSTMDFYIKGGRGMAEVGENFLVLYEDFYEGTKEEKKFTLAHEFTHIVEKHHLIKAVLSVTIPLASYIVTKFLRHYSALNAQDQNSGSSGIALQYAALIFDNSATRLLMNRYLIGKMSNYLEKRADINAVEKLMSKEGALSDLRKKNYSWNSYPFFIPYWAIYFIEGFKRLNFPIMMGFDDHPSNKERIAYIEKLKL